jgi:hypothetical protein
MFDINNVEAVLTESQICIPYSTGDISREMVCTPKIIISLVTLSRFDL